MIKFKCICCGEEKESDERCSCPVCGYYMYEMPYDRKELLHDEIIRFITAVIRPKITAGDLIFAGKAEDEASFPGFKRISSFIFSAPKTEVFVKRLKDTVDSLSERCHSDFIKTYKASPSYIQNISFRSEITLMRIMDELGNKIKFEGVEFSDILLDHREIPNDRALEIADQVFDKLRRLADKIYSFIVRNNMYSADREPDLFDDGKKDQPVFGIARLIAVKPMLDEALNKEYKVDLLDDGSQQLIEMLTVYCKAVMAVLDSPIRDITDIYSIGNGEWLPEELFYSTLSDTIASRFNAAAEIINRPGFLSDKDEEGLFDIYNKILEADSFGIFKVSKGRFVKGKSEKMLDKLIGLSGVKRSILKIKAFALANQDRNDLNLNMCFLGNPGTGKTEVARIIAGILYENGILATDKVVETDRSGLVAGYVGQTALKTSEKISEAMGGVLFIDEAYSLASDDSKNDYGHEAIATLIKAMEDMRGKFCVIFAGYRNQMQNMLSSNPGFKSRIQFMIDFPNYSREELEQITRLMLDKNKYSISEQAMSRLLDITDIKRKSPDFANAREIRNILDQVTMNQNIRCAGTDDHELGLVDVNTYIKDCGIKLPSAGEGHNTRVMTADEELDALVGLSSVKRMVKKIRAYAKRNGDQPDFNLHMCFYGNPGTGKTEVARILSRILYEAGVLPEAKLTETDSQGLIGKYVGSTAQKTMDIINDSMGGVLFIDEAYSLTQGDSDNGYGDEAVAVLLKQMEDKRGEFCVILAGYKAEMERLISSNPGFSSRIQFSLDFPDYTREELTEIAKRFITKKNYTIENNALSLMIDVCEYQRSQDDFANARTVRNIIDQVIMNQNLRTENYDNDNTIVKSDVEDYLIDEGIDLSIRNNGKKIGF